MNNVIISSYSTSIISSKVITSSYSTSIISNNVIISYFISIQEIRINWGEKASVADLHENGNATPQLQKASVFKEPETGSVACLLENEPKSS